MASVSEALAAANPEIEPELLRYQAACLAGRPIEPSVLVDAGQLVIWDAATGMQKFNRFKRFLEKRPEDLRAVRTACFDASDLVLRGRLIPPRSKGRPLVNQMRAAMQNVLRREMVFYGYFEGIKNVGSSSVLAISVDPATLDYQRFRHGEDDYTGTSFSDIYSNDSGRDDAVLEGRDDDRPVLASSTMVPKHLPAELREAAMRVAKREGLKGRALNERVGDLLMQPALLAALDTDYKCRHCLGMIERGGMIRVSVGNLTYGYCSDECAYSAGKAQRISDHSVSEIEAAIAAATSGDARSALRAMLATARLEQRMAEQGTEAGRIGARQRAGFTDYIVGRDGTARRKRGAQRTPIRSELFKATARTRAMQGAVARLSARDRFIWDHRDEPHGSNRELAANVPGGPVEEATYRQWKHRTISRVNKWTEESLATGSPNVTRLPNPSRRRKSS